MKKTALLILLICFSVYTAGCSKQEAGVSAPVSSNAAASTLLEPDVTVLTYAANNTVPKDLATQLSEFSNKKISLRTYGDSFLGADKEILKGVQLGTIDIMSGTPAGQYTIVPEAAVLDIPFVFDNAETADACLQDKILEWLQPYYNKSGLQIIAGFVPGYRELTCNKAIYSIDDFKDLRIRTVDNIYHQKLWSSLGGKALVMDTDKVYFALYSKSLDAQDNSIGAYKETDFKKLQPYVIMTNHIPFFMFYVMNKNIYDGLAPEKQKTIVQFFQQRAVSLGKASRQNSLTNIEKSGLTVLHPDEKLMNDMKQSSSLVIEMLEKDLGEKKVNDYLKLVGYQN